MPVYHDQFVDDTRGRGFLSKYSGVISVFDRATEPGEHKFQFSNQGNYIFGDGKQKTYRFNLLNGAGNGVHLISTRILNLKPMKRFEVRVNVDVISEDSRTNYDLDFLISIPNSAIDGIDETDKKYGNVILAA